MSSVLATDISGHTSATIVDDAARVRVASNRVLRHRVKSLIRAVQRVDHASKHGTPLFLELFFNFI